MIYVVNLYIDNDLVKIVHVEAEDKYEALELVENNPEHQLNLDVEDNDD